jgi:REP element-mobilizing transposase RayT
LILLSKGKLCEVHISANLSMKETRRTHRMHLGRLSRPWARYFITVCTSGRKPELACTKISTVLHAAWDDMLDNCDLEILCRTIMPDHVHLLVRVGERLALGQVMGKWKTMTRTILREHGLTWQRDFFERRLRPDDEAEPFGRYIFLNPYRDKLVSLAETWPYWRLERPEAFSFPTLLKDRLYPQPEWLTQSNEWRRTRGW